MPGSRSGPLDVTVDPQQLRDLNRDLRSLAEGKELRSELRRGLKDAAEPIKSQVKSNASWSSRIPAAVAVGTAFTTKRTGVFIRVNATKAPHARPMENDGQSGTFRHPTFGGEPWVAQQARPFFFDETAQHMDDVEQAVLDVMETVARRAGFH